MMPRGDVGVPGAPFTMLVEVGKIREMARATGSSHPEHLRMDRPVITPTFLMTAELWRDDKHDVLGLDLLRSGIVHGSQEFIFYGPPPHAGDRLVGVSCVERVYKKAGRQGLLTFVEAVTEYRDAGGHLVAETRGTLIRPDERAGENGDL